WRGGRNAEGRVEGQVPLVGPRGAPRLYLDGRFPTESGRPNLVAAQPGDPADPPDDEHPLVLTTGRIASQWHTMTRTGKSAELVFDAPEPFLPLPPATPHRPSLPARPLP